MSSPVQPELTGFVFCFGLVWGVLATLFRVYVA